MNEIIIYLSDELCPRVRRHGVLIEIYGEGVLVVGESGIGKTETAVELIKRGHRLVADDAVDLRRVSGATIMGSAPENLRNYVEIRGIGIIDIQRIFGVSAIKEREKVDMLVKLETWESGKAYERFGADTEYTEILGVPVPSITVPVRPGRNLAIIFELAALTNKQKRFGYNPAEELSKRLMESVSEDNGEN
jgi:HPr kinase/phosphorylase